MKKLFSVILILFIFSAVSGAVKPELKSRVVFKKNPSQSEIAGWEKDFFNNYESDFAEKAVTSDNDGEVSDNDHIQIKSVEKILIKPRENRKQSRTEIKKDEPVQGKIIPVLEESENVKNDKLLQQPEKAKKKQEFNIPESVENDAAEKVEKNDSDNEVDRSGQIRKMKELLKKRKGKNRIEDRRIY
ncbi:MAG TPA: hypothetical protein PKG52_06190 [bacterium]|nr:hypothetical protein [bacterium]HPS28623.1 hypothetical protein [bacterium]